MHFYKGLMQRKSVCDVNKGIDPCNILAHLWDRWWLDFVTFTAYKNVNIWLKKAQNGTKRRNMFQTVEKIYLSQNIFCGLVHFYRDYLGYKSYMGDSLSYLLISWFQNILIPKKISMFQFNREIKRANSPSYSKIYSN